MLRLPGKQASRLIKANTTMDAQKSVPKTITEQNEGDYNRSDGIFKLDIGEKQLYSLSERERQQTLSRDIIIGLTEVLHYAILT